MSDNRSSTKRSFDSSQQQQLPQTTAIAAATSTTSSNKRTRIMDLFSQHQLQTLQAELEHERKMRSMDQQRHKQTKKRLEKQLVLALEQAQDAQANLVQVQDESDRMMTDLREARNNAIEELRNCQLEMDDRSDEQSDTAIWEEKCRFLEQRVATYENQKIKWQEDMQKLQQQFSQELEKTTMQSPQKSPSIVEDAPQAVMKELCRVRTQLADTERKERQALRKIQDLETRNKTLLHEREEAKMASRRLGHSEKELKDIRAKYETLVAQSNSWQQFERQIVGLLKRQGISLCHDGGLPEISTIIRFLDQAQSGIEDLKREIGVRDEECIRLKASADTSRTRIRELEAAVDKHLSERKGLENEMQVLKRNMTGLEHKAAIYQKETGNLRELIKTFDNMPIVPGKDSADDMMSSPKLDTSLKTMEVRLNALQQEMAVMTEDRDRLADVLQQATQERQAENIELMRVHEKFEKLKDALHAERAKVEQAEARANHAEALAGKGAFNPERTRGLHMKESPLTEALKEEITVLRRRLEAMGETDGGISKPAYDPDKLNQRLKEGFKEQIALFREGVYLMTGFKVDMLPGAPPTFRVRTLYSEREHDHLMLRYPAGEDPVKSLDILSTDFAKELFSMPQHEYMTKFHSLPCFLASVQLALFEKQTVMM